MTIKLIILNTLILGALAGCNAIAGKKEFLTVDFQNARTLRYKFVSYRDIRIDWDPEKILAKPGKNTVVQSSESIDMVVDYTPIEIDPYGLTTIKATCNSVNVNRKGSTKGQRLSNDDVVTHFTGKSYTFTVDPAGNIKDYSQLDEIIRHVGEKAFRQNKNQGRIKEPDLVGDFIASQWFLWDSIASIEKPEKGIRVGQSWNSKLSVPAPMVIRKARNVTYVLDKIQNTENGRIAVIKSSYSPADSVPDNWPIPYSGQFRMSGTFGFLKDYNVLELQGQGEELFNIDKGRTELYNQNYLTVMDAALMIPLGANPQITIKQNLSMQLLQN